MNAPHIRPYVQRMYFRSSNVSKPFFEEFSSLLPCCTIFTSVFGWFRGDAKLLAQSDCLGYLQVGDGAGMVISPEFWTTGFENWTRLRVLEMEGHQKPFPNDFAAEGSSLLPSLRVLKLSRSQTAGGLPIPPTTPNTLHTLIVSNCEHSLSLRRVMFRKSFTADNNILQDDTFALLRSLESLVLHDFHPFPRKYFLSLTTSLTVIIFSSPLSNASFDCLQSLLETRFKGSRLQRIEMYTYGGSLRGPQWSKLIKDFRDVGVNLTFHVGYRILRNWEDEL
jgi:hypothetical protein